MLTNDEINARLASLQESDYKAFSLRLIPTGYRMLGIRIPALKKLAKEIARDGGLKNYLDTPDFPYYESVILYGLTLAYSSLPISEIFCYLDPLIKRFDNWAHVDIVISAFKVFRKHKAAVSEHFLPLKTDAGEFTKRSFIIIIMDYFMDIESIDASLLHLSETAEGQYYVDMAIAWALSVGFVRFYDKTLAALLDGGFSPFVRNKAIQKARESFRISDDKKAFLNTLKIKKDAE